MIPKKIHYCWFGRGEKPKLAQKCIASWKKQMPDYEIIEWNEDNFDVNMNAYTKMCYESKKYAFLTDYVRLFVIHEHGGIYFDTDVEAIRSFDDLLSYPAFFGFEESQYINTGEGFGAEAGNSLVLQMMDEYTPLLDGKHGVIGCPRLNTDALLRSGLQLSGEKQILSDAVILPADYLNPFDNPTGIQTKTKNTYSIHWYGKSWLSWDVRIRSSLMRPVHRLLGKDLFHKKHQAGD